MFVYNVHTMEMHFSPSPSQQVAAAQQRRRKADERSTLADAVVDSMAIDGLSCVKACETVGVPIGSFLRWVSEDADLAERYTRAREVLIERMAAETLAIADAPVGITERGTTDSGAVQKQRLQVDTRKWMLSKLAPKRYGDRVTNELANAAGEVLRLEQRGASPEVMRELTEALLSQVGRNG